MLSLSPALPLAGRRALRSRAAAAPLLPSVAFRSRLVASSSAVSSILERSVPAPPSSSSSAPSVSKDCVPAAEREGTLDLRATPAEARESPVSSRLPCPSLRRPYRDFLRACAKTFGEDFEARFYVTRQMTQLLRENPFNLPTDRLIRELKDASDFVRFHIIQAQLNPQTGAYRATPTDDHIRKGDVIELNGYDAERMQRLPWLSKKPGDALPSEAPRPSPTSKQQTTEAKF
ncbi:hypothetical protein BESB_028640 [Besnoitia besnoiti]|uniref:Uncharacterized protein n=1 Tax=Besnoitia besnoiti TaxID=94643 RepID=A0A2A9M0F1_BESBE|nr:uncharacterized protein BESB_028640 [Besnoitia besnoiti]PFH31429.1 hypothetical protein BESB_028640 [Besnoitia besnoiti]